MSSSPTTVQRKPAIVLWVIGFNNFFSAAGISMVALALPALGRDFGISIGQSAWVMLSFLLVASVFMLIAGRMGDILGLKRVFLLGTALFGLATLACGLAPTFIWLVLARGLQGLGAALVMATSPALLTTNFPPEQRGWVLGTVTSATYGGLTIGPMLGGLLVSYLTWRWVFLFTVPVSAAVLALGVRYLPGRARKLEWRFDIWGAVALAVWVPALLLPLAVVGKAGWLPWMGPSLGVAGVALGLFIYIETRVPFPLLELKLFRSRVFAGTVASALLLYVATLFAILLVPFLLEEGQGRTPGASGFILTAQPLAMTAVVFFAGRLSDRIGTRGLCAVGLLLIAVSMGLLSMATAATSTVVFMVILAVQGLGSGMFSSPNASALMGSAGQGQQGVAGAIMGVARNLGMVIGTALGTTVFLFAGGRTGHTWGSTDFSAFSTAMYVAAALALTGALISWLRGDAVKP